MFVFMARDPKDPGVVPSMLFGESFKQLGLSFFAVNPPCLFGPIGKAIKVYFPLCPFKALVIAAPGPFNAYSLPYLTLLNQWSPVVS